MEEQQKNTQAIGTEEPIPEGEKTNLLIEANKAIEHLAALIDKDNNAKSPKAMIILIAEETSDGKMQVAKAISGGVDLLDTLVQELAADEDLMEAIALSSIMKKLKGFIPESIKEGK